MSLQQYNENRAFQFDFVTLWRRLGWYLYEPDKKRLTNDNEVKTVFDRKVLTPTFIQKAKIECGRNDAVVSSKSVFKSVFRRYNSMKMWKLGRCRKKFPILRFQNCEVKFLFIRFFLFFRLQVQAVKGKINKQNTTKDSPKLQVWRKCAGYSGQSVFLLLREWRTAVTSGWELEFPPCYLRWKNSCWKACNKQILRHFSQILLWFDRFCDVFRNSSYRQRKVLQIQHFILNRSQ